MMEHKEVFALLVLDKREATLGLLKGTKIIPLLNLTSAVPGKIKAGGQCIFFESDVLLSTGTEIPIKEIQIGDSVETYNTLTRKFIPGKVVEKWNVIKPVFIINNTIRCSKDHAFLLANGTWKCADELTTKDVLVNAQGNSTPITSIIRSRAKEKLIDLTVSTQNFIANGLIVHNSAARFSRIREGAIIEFFKRIADACNQQFLGMKTELKGMLIGGPIPTKEEFHEGNYLNDELKRKVLGLKDIGDTSESGLQELVQKSQDLLAKEIIMEEKIIMEKFFTMLAKQPEKTAYGKAHVGKALDIQVVDTLLLSTSLPDEEIDQLAAQAEASGSTVKLISVDTSEGVQLKDLGGYAAILRYAIHD